MSDDQSPLARIPAADLVAELARRCGDEVELSSINMLLREIAKRFDICLILAERFLTDEQTHAVRMGYGRDEHMNEFRLMLQAAWMRYMPGETPGEFEPWEPMPDEEEGTE